MLTILPQKIIIFLEVTAIMNDYNFGNFLCALREKKGLTQAQIAKELGVTPAAVSKWENGSSKPRVDVLFRLAELLGVRTEELIAGRYIEAETLDADAVKQIREQYAYLTKVESHNTAGVKVRRLLAWVIDWNLSGIIAIVFAPILLECLPDPAYNKGLLIVGILLLMLSFPVCVILRDVIFGGRSVGKRIMGLVVLDKQTGLPAKRGKRIVRNLFLPILQIDVIFMLVTGTTVGDRAANTVVISKKMMETDGDDLVGSITQINSYKKPKIQITRKGVFLVVGVIVLLLAIILGATLATLSTRKDTEEYKLSYQYLVESEAFQSRDVDESKIWMNHYALSTTASPDGTSESGTARISFVVKWKTFEVVCHKENGVWQVCDECTEFE